MARLLLQLFSPIVRKGGGGSKIPGQEQMASRAMFGTRTAQREAWWTSTLLLYENITSVEDALTTYYLLLELSWSVKSQGLYFLNKYKHHHSHSSCKMFLNLAVLNELRKILLTHNTDSI